MFDLLFNPQKALHHPFKVSFLALLYSSVSLFVGLWIFSFSSSLAIIFLSTMSCLYVVQSSLRLEERKERSFRSESWLLRQHKSLVVFILALFLGFLFSFSLWSLFLPLEVSDQVFELQKVSLEQIQALTGNAVLPDGAFLQILSNNVNLVFVSLIFAFFFGAGALYILVWNASVMGYVIGSFARESFGLIALPVVAAKYFLHGIPEMVAYIIAAIAGGILYFAFIRGDLAKKDKVGRIIIDVVILILLSLMLLVLSALIEVFISPLI